MFVRHRNPRQAASVQAHRVGAGTKSQRRRTEERKRGTSAPHQRGGQLRPASFGTTRSSTACRSLLRCDRRWRSCWRRRWKRSVLGQATASLCCGMRGRRRRSELQRRPHHGVGLAADVGVRARLLQRARALRSGLPRSGRRRRPSGGSVAAARSRRRRAPQGEHGRTLRRAGARRRLGGRRRPVRRLCVHRSGGEPARSAARSGRRSDRRARAEPPRAPPAAPLRLTASARLYLAARSKVCKVVYLATASLRAVALGHQRGESAPRARPARPRRGRASHARLLPRRKLTGGIRARQRGERTCGGAKRTRSCCSS